MQLGSMHRPAAAMKFAVSKSSPVMVVAPSSSTGKKMKLSSWDRSFASSPITAFLVFDRAIELPIEAIKEGLALALVHYYPVAGRLAAGGGDDEMNSGEVYIACSGEGVPFVAASADCSLEDSKLLDVRVARDLLDDLAVYYGADNGCWAADVPLLQMQVTEFSCGGFVVGVTWNHVLADGDGMAQFMQAVGELTRGLAAPSVTPVRERDGVCLPVLSRAVVAAKQWLLLSRGGVSFAYLDFTVPSALISRIKSDFAAVTAAGEQHCTTFEVVVAVLWQCRTRAIGSDPGTTAVLSFFVNVRRHVGAKAGYYGNCVVAQVAMATAGEVASSDIVDVVRLVKRAKEGVPELLEGAADGDREDDDDGGMMNDMTEEELALMFGYDAFAVSSWRNIGFEAADLGGGTPARVLSRWQQSTTPGCVALLPCRDVDGGGGEVVQAQFLREEHVQPFLAHLAKLSSSSTTP